MTAKTATPMTDAWVDEHIADAMDTFFRAATAKLRDLESDRARLIEALQKMVKAHAALMPGLRHIAVQDYALQNDAPFEADRLLRELEGK